MDKISLIPTFKVLHWTISLRTFVLIANRKLILTSLRQEYIGLQRVKVVVPWGWMERSVLPRIRCLSSPLLHPQWSFTPQDSHGDPYKTPGSHLLGRLSIHDSKYSRLHYHFNYFFPKTFPNNVLLFPAVSLGCRGWWDSMSIPELVAVNSIWGGKWDAQKSRSHSGPMTEIGWDERETREHMIP